jgi:6-phosphogluconolactonase (cycloisomerase 2 family)
VAFVEARFQAELLRVTDPRFNRFAQPAKVFTNTSANGNEMQRLKDPAAFSESNLKDPNTMKTHPCILNLLTMALIGLGCCATLSTAKGQRLTPAGSVTRPDLATVVSVEVSGDNRHLYSAAYNASSVGAFQRDPKTGQLTHVQTLTDTNLFNGVTSIRVSADGRYAATAAFRSAAAVLLKRDAASGQLAVLDVARQGVNSVNGLNFAIDTIFSPDSRFVYVIADGGAALNVFRVTDRERLEWVQTHRGEESCFQGARGIVLSPDGRFIYVASSKAHCIVVLERDRVSGKATLKQIVRDEAGAAHGLAGAFSVACSPDGRHLYVSAGRFGGDSAVTVFARGEDGNLGFSQELFGGQDGIKDFAGGNEVIVTPDGSAVYALGSISGSIACLGRDAVTGKLIPLETLVGGVGKVGPLRIVSGICLSQDGKFVYAAVERDGAISIFSREAQLEDPAR